MLPFIPATVTIPFAPVAAIALIGAAWYVRGQESESSHYGEMTAERQVVFDTALQTLKDPNKLRYLADAFGKEGLDEQADLLRKRAALREVSPEIKRARKQAFRKAMMCKDPVKVRAIAKVFAQEGATGAASKLNQLADGLERVQSAA